MISIIIPYIRPQNMAKLEELIWVNSGIKYELIKEEDKERIGCPKMVSKLVAKAKYDIVCFLGDDTEPQHNFLLNAYDAMCNFKDNWGLVGLNDLTGRNLPCHWIAHKKLLEPLGGEFFHTGYKHCYCDLELWDRAVLLNRYMYCLNAIVKHNHPIFTGKPMDDDYIRVYSNDYKAHDKSLYETRKLNGYKS